MLEKYLKQLLKTDLCSEDELDNLDEYIQKESTSLLLDLITDVDFSGVLFQSTTKIIYDASTVPLSFYFLMMLINFDPTYFKKIIEIPDLKNIFLKATEEYRKEHDENPFFEPILTNKSADENLVAILADGALNRCFYTSRHAGRDLTAFTRNHPSKIEQILSHPVLKIAIMNDKDHRSAIGDILSFSQSKKDADLVFSNPFFGAWREQLKIEIYNKIAENYRANLPNSLVKCCLFSISENKQTLSAIDNLTEELQEAIYNFSKT
ncbi:hypothetical protein TUM19329_33040 [Legionella antarctica]|uniref:Uncharacterized protein n=1 Tax=Legionella antarctica TaxID=2708020 RepID=A0A6F8T9M6_9GAMM|nr:hypothetical protein [Legionella antarctica]BCA96943.1 hypothetical protein TUM19329_33040 [Legionella antarctica]